MFRVIDHAWHLAHSYRLHALPWEFAYYPIGSRYWDTDLRPQPPNFLGFDESPDFSRYDMVLTHLDNWCDRTPLRATPFRVLNALAAAGNPTLLRVTINHGTPDDRNNRLAITRMLHGAIGGQPFLVCNSKQAVEQWGLGPQRSRAIIHGYKVDEFWSSKERHPWAATVSSAGTMSRTYHGVPLLEYVRRHVPVVWVGHNGDLPYFTGYDAYREFLSHTLIYVHLGQRSPMPGARTEAMLSGCCVVTTSNHDAAEYIEHGETGYLCDDPLDAIDTIKMLLSDPRQAYRVGQRGREAAREFFNHERYVADWLRLVEDLRAA